MTRLSLALDGMKGNWNHDIVDGSLPGRILARKVGRWGFGLGVGVGGEGMQWGLSNNVM